MLTYHPGYSSRKDLNNFYQDICEQPFRADGTTPGILHSLLNQGEFGGLGKVPIFESTFLQVTNRGEFINIHNHPNIITVGILASSPRMLLPNLLVIAQEKKDENEKEMEIKRMVPLEMVDIFVHNLSKRRLKIQMITGRKYYLQLCAPEEEEGFLFERWIRLIYLLRTTRGIVRTSMTSMDPTLRMIWKSANIQRQTYPASKKDHAIIPTKIKDSVELIREQHSQESPSRKKQKKTQISSASTERILRSGLVQYASLESLGLSPNEEYNSTDKHKVSFSKGPLEPMRRIANQPPAYGLETQTGPSKARRSSLSKSSKYKQPSAQYTLQGNSSDMSPEYSALLANTEPSVPFTYSVTASFSKQMGAKKHTQMRDVGSHLFSKAEGSNRTSLESDSPVIKLQKSQKSRSLVQTPPVLPPEVGHSHSEKKHATESQVKRPSSRGGRETSASQNFSRKQSQPEPMSPSTRSSAAGTAPRYHSSVSVASSFGQLESSWPTSAKPKVSEKSESPILGSHPGKKASRASSRKSRISDTNAISSEAPPSSKEVPADTGDRPASRELSQRSKPSRTQTASVTSQKPRKATSRRSQTSSSPSPERGYSTSRSPDRKKSPGSQLHRTDESASLALSQTNWKTGAGRPSETARMDQIGQESQALKPDKQKELEMRSSRAKSGKQYQPSSSKPSRAQVNESKKKLRSALSSAKQKSSLTFVTIYSALSSSLEKIKGTKSKEDTKLHLQEKTPQVSTKPSKRVTISGVIGPSGKDFGQQEAENLTTTDTEGMNEDSSIAATLGTEASEVSSPSQFREPNAAGPLGAAVRAESSKRGHISSAAEPLSPDSEIILREPSVARSMIPQKPSRGGTGQSSARNKKSQSRTKKTPRSKLPSSKHSEKSPSTRVASIKRKVTTVPPRSKKVTTAGVSVDAVDTGGGNRVWEQEEPSVHPQKKRKKDEHWRPSSHPSSGPTKPTSSVSRKASRRSKVRGVKHALAARSHQQTQTSRGERTSPRPAGHLSEEKTRKSKTSKKSHVPQDEVHHRIEAESGVMEDLHMSKVIGGGQRKMSSKIGLKLQDSRLFRPGGWLEYVERGDEKSTDNRPSSPKSKMAASSVAIHASGDTVVRIDN